MDKRKFLILALATFLRFYNLDYPPFFFDESVHTVFVDNVLSGNYRYDPAFHGPLLFYLTSIPVSIFGKFEFAYRLVPAIFGVLTVALIFKFDRFFGSCAYYSALLVAVSPIIVNYSRFFRNESQILFFTLAFVYLTFRYLESRKFHHLLLASISLSLFACSKENFYPIVPLLLIYFLFDIKKFIPRHVILSILAFLFVYFALYTNLFTIPITIKDFPAFKAIGYWKYQHDIARIGGPSWYYIPLIFLYDLPVLMLGIYAIVRWILRREDNIRYFLIYWFIVNLVFYSYVQEKVPWLVVHMELPLYMIAGICLGELRRFKIFTTLLTFSFLLYSCIQLNIVNPTNPAEPALYLPTSMDVKHFRDELKDLNISKICVFMSPGDYWPLPCYLKDFKVYYSPHLDESFIERCEVVILNESNFLKVNLNYTKKDEICLRSWVGYEDVNPVKVFEFLIFRRPMGKVHNFNHTVIFR